MKDLVMTIKHILLVGLFTCGLHHCELDPFWGCQDFLHAYLPLEVGSCGSGFLESPPGNGNHGNIVLINSHVNRVMLEPEQ